MEKFRKLRADEIECRVSQINEKGLTLLLYKDARCDMRLLDEVVGPEHWQCRYEDHKGTLFCSVGILDIPTGLWVWKEDAGAPSNMESQKGEASDAFKRACFRWGIGRELYTAPFIWVPAGNYQAFQDKGKWKTFDRFEVTSIGYDGENIIQLTIINQKTRRTVFEMKGSYAPAPEKPRETASTSSEGHIKPKDWKVLQGICKEKDKDPTEVLLRYGYSKPSEVTTAVYEDMIKALEEGKL